MTGRQKRRMVKFTGSVVSVLCIGVLLGAVYARTLDAEARTSFSDTKEEREIELPDVLEEDLEETEEKAAAEEEEPEEQLPGDWNLILVNKTHLVPEDYQVELKPIGSGHQIDARAYDDYKAMIKAAKREGVYIYVTSSYRDMEKQTKLHEQKIESLVMEGYPYEEAKELAAQVVAVPGTSEHQLGLALDLVSSEYRRLDEKQENTRGFQWLKEHCAEYGFILRYPNGKTDITGIIYEPWHFRYVGLEAAKEITEAGLTLEEYLGAKPISEGFPEAAQDI